eukprot:snap_masked-scaffold_5-processed-gene-12.24-mRNA-1 protein AED:1.00 eAED:1.00 QI:0/-1/0/0/-1/1/1/0/64
MNNAKVMNFMSKFYLDDEKERSYFKFVRCVDLSQEHFPQEYFNHEDSKRIKNLPFHIYVLNKNI